MKIYWRPIFFLILCLILTNVIFLDLKYFSKIPTPVQNTIVTKQDECGEKCQAQIQTSITSALEKLPTTTPVIQKQVVSKITTNFVKEYFAPIGSGSTQNDQWEDVAGTDVYIDTASYPNINTAYFEASLRVPTKNGTVYARLYNVTDKHPVWFSDVFSSADTSTFVSSKIRLDQGNKQYRVQMKTTLRYLSYLDTARVKIITK